MYYTYLCSVLDEGLTERDRKIEKRTCFQVNSNLNISKFFKITITN